MNPSNLTLPDIVIDLLTYIVIHPKMPVPKEPTRGVFLKFCTPLGEIYPILRDIRVTESDWVGTGVLTRTSAVYQYQSVTRLQLLLVPPVTTEIEMMCQQIMITQQLLITNIKFLGTVIRILGTSSAHASASFVVFFFDTTRTERFVTTPELGSRAWEASRLPMTRYNWHYPLWCNGAAALVDAL